MRCTASFDASQVQSVSCMVQPCLVLTYKVFVLDRPVVDIRSCLTNLAISFCTAQPGACHVAWYLSFMRSVWN